MASGDVYTIADSSYVNANDPLVAVFHVRDTDGAGSLTDLLTQWEAHGWNHYMKTTISSDTVFDVVSARKILPYGSGSQFIARTTDAGGSAGGAVIALNSAAVVTWYTGNIGRRKRGRTFLAGVVGSYNVKGLWTSTPFNTWNTNLTNFLNFWKTGGTSAHYELGVWSRATAGPTPPFSSAAFTPITQFTARTWFRSQRRRDYGISIGRSA